MPRNLDLYGFAANRLFQIQLQRVTQVCTTGGPAATTAATEDVTKHIPEDVGEAGATTAAKAATGLAINAGVTKLVVSGTFRIVGQNLVSFAGLFELVLGVGVVRVTVGVILHRELAISSLDFLLVRIPGNTENVVIIALGHALKPCFLNAENAGDSPAFSNCLMYVRFTACRRL